MLRVNRTFLFIYDILIVIAFILRLIMVGPVLFHSTWCFWLVFIILGLSVVFLSYFTFFHPTPLEIVAYHVNLIMRHPVDEQDEDELEEYSEQNKLYLSERFIQSPDYEFFYYGDCCAKTDQYRRMKIKLAIGTEEFNRVSIIIKTVDEQYIRFNLVKQIDSPFFAFLSEWEIDQIEYSDATTFDRMVKGVL